MWLIKPGKSGQCIDLTGKVFGVNKNGQVFISETYRTHHFTYSSTDAANAVRDGIIAAIKSGAAYFEPQEAGLERGKHEWVTRKIEGTVDVGNQVSVYVDGGNALL